MLPSQPFWPLYWLTRKCQLYKVRDQPWNQLFAHQPCHWPRGSWPRQECTRHSMSASSCGVKTTCTAYWCAIQHWHVNDDCDVTFFPRVDSFSNTRYTQHRMRVKWETATLCCQTYCQWICLQVLQSWSSRTGQLTTMLHTWTVGDP